MKEIFANADAGMIGLAIFITLFLVMLIWLYRPGVKNRFKEFGHIPLKDE